MKRVPSQLDCVRAGPPSPCTPLTHGLFGRIHRRLSITTSAAAEKAASLSSYIRRSSSPPLGSMKNMVTMTRQLSLGKVLNAVSAASYPSGEEDLTVDLDWRPKLSLTHEVTCWSCAAVAACIVYMFTAPPAFSIPYATCIGLLFGLVLYALRGALLEEMYKARERIEADLGDPDSRFRHIDNLSVHVKVKAAKSLPAAAPTAAAARLAPLAAAAGGGGGDSPSQGPVPALHCYHGFGSNTWSWSLVQQQLADRLGALVTAHDMPGFGLTERPTDLSVYYLAFNGRLGRLALDYELAVRGLLSHAEATKSGEAGYPHTSVHEAAAAAAAPAGPEGPTSSSEVEGLEGAAGGSAGQAAQQAVQQGLESPLQATAAAAVEGSVTGVVKGAAAAVSDAATGGSGSDAGGAAAAPSSSSSAATAGSPSSAAAAAAAAGGASQQRVKRVLIGHSLGGACAALEFIFNPSEYAAVVLVDPAIIAGLSMRASEDGDGPDSQAGSGGPDSQAGSGAKPTLQKLQDGTAFTRSLATGEFEEPEAAAAAAHLEAAAAAAAGRRSSSSSSTYLDELAAAQGNLTRSSSSSNAAASSNGSATPSSGSAVAGMNAAAAAGEVVFYATRGDDAAFQTLLSPSQPKNLLGTLVGRVLSLAQTAAMLSTVLVISVLRPAIVVMLRSLVRSRTFWANTLKQAYYDKSKVTPAAVDAYRLPQLVKGWETGMVQFLLARLGAGGAATTGTAAAAVGAAPMGGLEDAGLATRFAAAVAASNVPVLIVHGAGDKLVPASNSFNLARLLKGCRLAIVKKAGHCPQEEQPELFADIVSSFVKKHVGV